MRQALTAPQVAALIQDALDEEGMSQADFCRLAGVSQKHLSAVFLGKAAAPMGTLDYWAFLLGREVRVRLVKSGEAEAPR